MSKTEASIENIYKLDGRVPVVKAIPFGLQHILAIFPRIVQTVFAENCVAVVFIVAIILNLVLPKNMEAHTSDTDAETNVE